jgi:hypothetical protein
MAAVITISAEVVAWYGAIVSTLTAGVSTWSVWRDKPSLRVTAQPNMMITGQIGPYTPEKTYIIIDVANTGRHPIVLDAAFLKVNRGKPYAFVKGDWIPKANLSEGESAKMFCIQKDDYLDSITHIIVRDATGRKWTAKFRKD